MCEIRGAVHKERVRACLSSEWRNFQECKANYAHVLLLLQSSGSLILLRYVYRAGLYFLPW